MRFWILPEGRVGKWYGGSGRQGWVGLRRVV